MNKTAQELKKDDVFMIYRGRGLGNLRYRVLYIENDIAIVTNMDILPETDRMSLDYLDREENNFLYLGRYRPLWLRLLTFNCEVFRR